MSSNTEDTKQEKKVRGDTYRLVASPSLIIMCVPLQ
jgi:hypothetical protein